MSNAKANLDILTERVNLRCRRPKPYGRTYIAEVRAERRGAASLRTIVREEEARLLRETADEVESA